MEEEILKQFMSLLAGGAWAAVGGFGAFLAYKLAMTSVISYSVVRVFSKIVDAWAQRHLNEQRFMSLIASAGLKYPLTDQEWDILQNRVKPGK